MEILTLAIGAVSIATTSMVIYKVKKNKGEEVNTAMISERSAIKEEEKIVDSNRREETIEDLYIRNYPRKPSTPRSSARNSGIKDRSVGLDHQSQTNLITTSHVIGSASNSHDSSTDNCGSSYSSSPSSSYSGSSDSGSSYSGGCD